MVERHLSDVGGARDPKAVLADLTEDVEWLEVGAEKPVRGKQAYEAYMKPGAEVAQMRTEVTRVVEEGKVVVAEGLVRLSKRDGTMLKIQFCDVFEFEGQKIARKTSYTSVVK